MRRITRAMAVAVVVLVWACFNTSVSPASTANQRAVDTTRYVVIDHGRLAGETVITREGDTTTVRYHTYIFDDRIEARYRILANGTVADARIQPLTPDGRPTGVASRIQLFGDSVRRSGSSGTSATQFQPGTYYGHAVGVGEGFLFGTFSGTVFEQLLLARFLLRQPQYTGKFPDGTSVRLEVVKDTTVRVGAARERVRMMAFVGGAGTTRPVIWLNSRGDLFASTQIRPFVTVRADAQSLLPALRGAELALRATEAEGLAHRLLTPVQGQLVIVNGDLFDADRGIMLPRTTVVIAADRVITVGPADSVATPAGATIIDASGKTIIPGLWDMHAHGAQGAWRLATGITTERNLGQDVDVAVWRRDATAAGRVAGPRQVVAGFLEGPGRRASPTHALVHTEQDALQWIARYDSLGYVQIKVYNRVHPDLLPVIAEEAHRREMRVSGHVPRGLTVPAAVALGFDEIHHAAFLFATFYQDSLWVPTIREYSAVARAVAPTFNVDGAAMSDLIDVLTRHNTVIDGTFNIYVDTTYGGGRAATENYLRLIRRLYDAGLTLVPGTDNPPATAYNDELELYERAGIPAPEVLQMATIISARVMRQDRDYGSIVPGKVADLIVVNGRPAERVSDLRNVEYIVRGGRLYNARQMREVMGRNP